MTLETGLTPEEQRAMRNDVIRLRGIVRPRCWFCNEIVAVGYFCFGCQEFVCDECNNGEACGDHRVEEHCKSEVIQ